MEATEIFENSQGKNAEFFFFLIYPFISGISSKCFPSARQGTLPRELPSHSGKSTHLEGWRAHGCPSAVRMGWWVKTDFFWVSGGPFRGGSEACGPSLGKGWLSAVNYISIWRELRLTHHLHGFRKTGRGQGHNWNVRAFKWHWQTQSRKSLSQTRLSRFPRISWYICDQNFFPWWLILLFKGQVPGLVWPWTLDMHTLEADLVCPWPKGGMERATNSFAGSLAMIFPTGDKQHSRKVTSTEGYSVGTSGTRQRQGHHSTRKMINILPPLTNETHCRSFPTDSSSPFLIFPSLK